MAPSVLEYHSDSSTFGLAFSPLSTPSSLRLAVASFSAEPSSTNNISVIETPSSTDLFDLSDDELDERYGYSKQTHSRVPLTNAFNVVARTNHAYPASKVDFSPAKLSNTLQNSSSNQGEQTRELVATSSDCLRIWDIVEDYHHQSSRLVQRAVLTNSKTECGAPVTSFSWSQVEPTHIVTSSIDTTCTVWDISTSTPITQLIAHDREVYDVAWSPTSRDVFASVGADGSVRMFDLRSLEHSTILYEATPPLATKPSAPPKQAPLLRLAFSPTSSHYISVVHADSTDVQILDSRSPGTPSMELRCHRGAVNGLAWGTPPPRSNLARSAAGGSEAGSSASSSAAAGGPGWLATCSDDHSLLLWDLSVAPPVPPPRTPPQAKVIREPTFAYTAPSEINTAVWGAGGEWIALGCDRRIRCVRVP